jgi:hypothetical protein
LPRSKKQEIKINDNSSLQGLLQEVYNNACNQITDAQKVVNEIGVGSVPEDVDDWAKVAKAKTDALKVKDSAIKTKLDVGRLQSDIIKFSGEIKTALDNNPEVVSNDSFAKIREMINESKSKE